MAQCHADPSRLASAPPGERLAYDWLSSELPGSYSVWHEPCVDGRKPDLVLFGPQIGLMVLEVKDWSRDAILEVDGSGRVRVRHSDGEKLETHPIVQARDAVYVVANRLEKEAPCRQNTGAHEGKLAFPWNVGAIFPNLTKNEAVELGLERGHPEGSIITGDDIGGRLAWALGGDKVAKRLESLCVTRFSWQNDGAKRAAIDRTLAPPTVIAGSFAGRAREREDPQLFLLLPGTDRFTTEQEQMARDLRPGREVLQGVAGSGKSEVIASQARLLTEAHRGWRILVLCYNVSLAGWLRTRVFANGALQQHDVTVSHFHGWCREQLDRAGIPFDADVYASGGNSSERFVEITRDAFRDGRILRRYHAILVDEAQDFSPAMIETCQAALEPGNSKLLLALDNAQHIYTAAAGQPLSALGIKTSTTKVLKDNLRCSREINCFSRRFLFGEVAEGDSIRVGDRRAYVPRSSERSGLPVHVERCADPEAEIEWAALWCQDLLEKGYRPDEIAVLYARRSTGSSSGVGSSSTADGPDVISLASHHFAKYGNELFWVARDARAKEDAALLHNKIHLSTVHSFKGLEARAVALVGANVPAAELEHDVRTRALWYVGMTRATDRLAVTWSDPQGFGARLSAFVES